MADFRVYSWTDALAGKISGGASALTVGVFDGPHRGHWKLVEAVRAQTGVTRGAVTFSGISTKDGGAISTMPQRLAFFKECGLDCAIVIDFSGDFCKMDGREFLSVLTSRCGMVFLAEGDDFRCGYQGAYGIAEITRLSQELAFTLDVQENVLYRGARVSSSRIRDAVRSGAFGDVRAMLGRPYALDCAAWEWRRGADSLWRAAAGNQALPMPGVYRVYADGVSAEARISGTETAIAGAEKPPGEIVFAA